MVEKIGFFCLGIILIVILFFVPPWAPFAAADIGRLGVVLPGLILLVLALILIVVLFFVLPDQTIFRLILRVLTVAWFVALVWWEIDTYNDYHNHLCVDTTINQYVRDTPEVYVTNNNIVCHKDDPEQYKAVKP